MLRVGPCPYTSAIAFKNRFCEYRANTPKDLNPRERTRSCPHASISRISKEMRDMAEAIATLTMLGIVVAVATGLACLAIYFNRE